MRKRKRKGVSPGINTTHKQSHKHLTLHRNKKLNKHLTLHNIHRNTFTKTQTVGESNVNGKEKDSSEAVGLELMVISFMQSFLVEYPQAKYSFSTRKTLHSAQNPQGHLLLHP